MKKIRIILAVVSLMILVATLVAACASSGGGGSSKPAAAASDGPAAPPYSVDLSGVTYEIFNQASKKLTDPGKGVKSTSPLKAKYDGVLFYLPAIDTDVTKYKRITINAKLYNSKGDEVRGGGAMVVLVYDPKGDKEGPEMGPGKNTPIKEFNFSGTSTINTPNGSRLMINQAPGAVLFQCTTDTVKYFELTEVTLHNGRD